MYSSTNNDSDWLASLRERDQQHDQEIGEQADELGKHIDPIDLLLQIDACTDDNSQIIADGGGFALGAKAHRAEKETWLIFVDGPSAYSLAEFDTFVCHGMGVIVRRPRSCQCACDSVYKGLYRQVHPMHHARFAPSILAALHLRPFRGYPVLAHDGMSAQRN